MLRVCFNCYGNYTTDKVYQWDQNHTIKVMGLDLDYAPAIHFCNKLSTEAIVVHSEKVEDGFTAPIPNILLQEPYNIFAYVHIYDVNNESAKTIELVTIPLVKRIKPSEYEFIDNSDIMNFERLETDIADFIAKMTADFEEHKEYVESLVYKPTILFNCEDFTMANIPTYISAHNTLEPIGIGWTKVNKWGNIQFRLREGKGLNPSGNGKGIIIPIINSLNLVNVVSVDNPLTITFATNEGVISRTLTDITVALDFEFSDTTITVSLMEINNLVEYGVDYGGIPELPNKSYCIKLVHSEVSSDLLIHSIKAEYSPVFTGFAPKPYERYLDSYYSNQYSDANLETAKAYTDTTAIEVMKSENLLFNADFAYNSPMYTNFNGVGDPGLAGWETLTNVTYKSASGLLVTPDIGGPFLVQWLDANTGGDRNKESGYLTIEWSTKTDTSTINTLVVPVGADKENYISSSYGNSFTLNGVDMQVYLNGPRFHLQIPTPVTATDDNTTYIRSLKYEANDKATPIVHSSVESARLEAIADHVDARVSGCLTTANSYADSKANTALTNAKTYADSKDSTTLQSAKDYVQSEIRTTDYIANYAIYPNDTLQNCVFELHTALSDLQSCNCHMRYGGGSTALVMGLKYSANQGTYIVLPRNEDKCFYMRINVNEIRSKDLVSGTSITVVTRTALA